MCPSCQKPSLLVDLTFEVGKDTEWDQITLQVLRCKECDFTGLGLDCASFKSGGEGRDHSGYPVNAILTKILSGLLRTCSKRRDPNCRCLAHRLVGRRDPAGYWKGIGLNEGGFKMDMAD